MTVIDNGNGMVGREFEEFHDIAATAKERGEGIGFAGIGVKLALLVAKEVITETKGDSFHKATRWTLESPRRAPWEYIAPHGLIDSPSGTAVSVIFPSDNSGLLSDHFIEHVVQTHFYPILRHEFMDKILKHVYKRGMEFYVNGRKIQLPQAQEAIQSKLFTVKLGRKRKPVGVGFLSKSKEELPEDERGIAVSTYGKVIKRGWDWIGIAPQNPMRLSGIVEVPQLSEILTTNKADFLRDTASLQKYYRYRKAIQEAIEPILRELGQISVPQEGIEKALRPLEKEIERVLENMLDDFPELSSLLGIQRRAEPVSGIIPDASARPIETMVEWTKVMMGTRGGSGEGAGIEATEVGLPGERIKESQERTELGGEHKGRRKRSGLIIGFDDNPDRDDLGWLIENIIWINKAHPAYQRAMDSGAENYHIVLTVAWVLSGYLEGEKSPQEFINRVLRQTK